MRTEIERALPAVLASLPGYQPTGIVSHALAMALHGDAREAAAIGKVLTALAPSHPSASHDGSTFRLYGRTMRRWRWRCGGETAVEKATRETLHLLFTRPWVFGIEDEDHENVILEGLDSDGP